MSVVVHEKTSPAGSVYEANHKKTKKPIQIGVVDPRGWGANRIALA